MVFIAKVESFFSSNDRCNIYENTIEDSIDVGNDIAISVDYYGIAQSFMDVILDTFTVLTPTDYHATPIDSFSFDILNGLETVAIDNEILPFEFALHTPYPNPFNPATKIGFTLPKSEKVWLRVFDINGRLIYTLIDDEIIAPGYHEYSLQSQQIDLASGIYLYKLETTDWVETRKMLFIK